MLMSLVYFLVFLVPGLFATLVYNRICARRMEGCNTARCNTISLALLFDMFIVGINFAVLHWLKGTSTIHNLQNCFTWICFIPKYILLSLVVGIILAILACLLTRLCRPCKKHNNEGGNDCK